MSAVDHSSHIGAKFNSWTVLGVEFSRRARYLCRCECGTEALVVADTVVQGMSRMCRACSYRERSRPRTHGATVGRSYAPEWNSWRAMIERCGNPQHKAFAYYGGRGIRVCEQWKGADGFAQFFACVGRKPSPQHSIDRINTDGNYEPGNVRWATASEQRINQRRMKKEVQS